MFFSEKFNVDRELIIKYGAVDISLVCDLPLFIDPMLIFNSKKLSYQKLHNYLIKYFAFLTEKSEEGVNKDEIKFYFTFSEIKNNWLGYAKKGNGGKGLGEDFAIFLSDNLKFIMNNNGITKSHHIEKALLIYDGNGKDKISDLTVNLILDYLASYTQKFAIENIDEKFLDYFYLDSIFNFKTQSFENKEYKLPFLINDKGEKEYILLTPYDILREEDPAISKKNLRNYYQKVRNGITNKQHRAQLNNYIRLAVNEYIISQKKKKKKKISDAAIEIVERNAFFKALKEKEFAWLYDYFIKIIEENNIEINKQALEECISQIEKFYNKSEQLRKCFNDNIENLKINSSSARNELMSKLLFFKDTIENKEGYKLLYHNGENITSEDDLQRLFRFTIDGTPYDFNFDANNGLGEYDIKASKGSKDKCIAELKLASNTKLSHVFKQTKVYEKSNNCKDSIVVIFYFNNAEKQKVNKLMKEDELFIKNKESIILIDCDNSNKISASKR